MPKKRRRSKEKLPKNLSRDERRRIEVLHEFVEAGRIHGTDNVVDGIDEGPILSAGLYVPPWREKLTNGELGPFYGPQSQAVLDKLISYHNTSIHGGGIWDYDEEPDLIVSKTRKRIGREDSKEIDRFVYLNSGSLSLRELEAYTLYFVEEKSAGSCAKIMGCKRQTVYDFVQNLRNKRKLWLTKRMGTSPILRAKRVPSTHTGLDLESPD